MNAETTAPARAEPTGDSPTDLLSDRAVADPHAVFAELRRLGGCVWLPEHHAWLLTTHAQVADGFRDAGRLSSDRLTPLRARLEPARRELLDDTFELLSGWMVFHDEPDHRRLREPLARAFTPRTVEGLRPRIESIVGELLDGLAERQTCDLVAEYAFELPAIVIAELLGVPPADRDEFTTWSDQLAAIVFGASNRPDQAETAAEGTARFVEYFTWLIQRHEAEPADDLTSALISVTRDDPGGVGLTPSELVGALTLLLFGGHETTTNLISSAARALALFPDQRAWLGRHPEAIGPAVEELHRWDGPTKVMVRIASAAHARDGQQLEDGQTVFLGVASASRDPALTDRPDELVLDRSEGGRHLGFGFGGHFCLGAFLARVEAQVAVRGLIQRFGAYEPAVPDAELTWSPTLLGRSLRALPVVLDP